MPLLQATAVRLTHHHAVHCCLCRTVGQLAARAPADAVIGAAAAGGKPAAAAALTGIAVVTAASVAAEVANAAPVQQPAAPCSALLA